MSLKEIIHPKLDRIIKFGRLHDTKKQQKLPRLAKYLTSRAKLPTPPATLNLTAPALTVLRDVELNNQLGDCVIAGKTHVDAVWTGNAGRLFAATKEQVIAQYSAIGHYVPGQPSTDQGCNMADAIAWWAQNPGADGTKILGGLSVDATNPQEIMLAVSLFENGYLGMCLPDAWINAIDSISDSTVWDVAGNPDPANGHCVCGVGYTKDGLIFDTWGDLPLLTWAALAKYAAESGQGEFDVLVSEDMLIKGQNVAPNGIDWATLVNDANAIFGGNFTVPPTPSPSPSPAPSPAPAPGATVAVADVMANLSTSFAGFEHALMTRGQALTLAQGAVTAAIKDSK